MKNKHPSPWIMFALLVFSYALVSMDRRIFYAFAGSVRFDLGLSQSEILLASDATLLGIGVTGIGAGYLLRSVNRKGAAIAGLLIASIATFAISCSHNFMQVFAARLMVGVGVSLQLVAILAIGINYFVRHRSYVVAAVFFAEGLGSVIGLNLGAMIDEASGWRPPLACFALAGLLMALAVFLFVKPWVSQARLIVPLGAHQALDATAKSMWSRRPMVLAAITLLLGLALFGYRDFFNAHLREMGGFTWQTGNMTLSLYAFGSMFAFYGASIFEKYGGRTVLMTSFLLTGACSLLIFVDVWHSTVMHVLLSLLLGIGFLGIATVTVASEMIKSVAAAQGPPIVGLFTACLFLPATLSGPLARALEASMGWSAAGMVQVSGSVFFAALIATRLPGRQPVRFRR
ncbi:MFS transporter [Pseudomonas frederiksbergensis]|uniref:MFS transporter n=1 Tax=Pseudomonas frederiksbergensis TaxID=104087 RepID=UPI003CFF9404